MFYGVKFLCCLLFVACLLVCTWYKWPIERISREDLRQTKEHALAKAKLLEQENARLHGMALRADQHRMNWMQEHAKVATEKIILGNQIANMELKLAEVPRLEADIEALEESLERAHCWKRGNWEDDFTVLKRKAARFAADAREAEQSLSEFQSESLSKLTKVRKERDEAVRKLKTATNCNHQDLFERTNAQNKEIVRLRKTLLAERAASHDRLAERMSESSQLQWDLKAEQLHHRELKAAFEVLAIAAAPAQVTALVQQDPVCVQASDDSEKQLQLTRLENTRDQASTDLLKEHQGRIEQLEQLLQAKDAARRDSGSESLGNQLDETENLKETIAQREADYALLQAQQSAASMDLQIQLKECQDSLAAKAAELSRNNASHLAELAQHLGDLANERVKSANLQNALSERDMGMDIDTHIGHVCDHSQCVKPGSQEGQAIVQQQTAAMARDLKVGELKKASVQKEVEMVGLRALVDDKKAAIQQLQDKLATSDSQMSHLKNFLGLSDKHDLASMERVMATWKAASEQVSAANQGHTCDHSVCDKRHRASTKEIDDLGHSLKGMTAKFEDRERKLAFQATEMQKASRKSNMGIKEMGDRLRSKEKEWEAERAGHQAALAKEREVAKERYEKTNPLRDQVAGLRKALEEMRKERDRSRKANEAFQKDSAEAREVARESEAAQLEAARQRDELARVNGGLELENVRMQLWAQGAQGSGGSGGRKREEGEEAEKAEVDLRPAKFLKEQ